MLKPKEKKCYSTSKTSTKSEIHNTMLASMETETTHVVEHCLSGVLAVGFIQLLL